MLCQVQIGVILVSTQVLVSYRQLVILYAHKFNSVLKRPGFFLNAFANDAYVEGLSKCVTEGLAQAVGVSNFREDRLRTAHRILSERGIPLASNQVQYSLLYRTPERNGVLETCNELGVTLVAYSPLCQGLLTGTFLISNFCIQCITYCC